jgi:uncharacterized sulfatase
MFETPSTRVWKELYDQGKLKPPKTHFWESKPPEELYDLHQDPDEVNNLAGSAGHEAILKRMRDAQRGLALRIRDVGFLPEGEIHSRSKGSTPYQMGHDEKRYPIMKIMSAADLASSGKPDASARLLALFDDPDSAVRYWAVTGILARGPEAVKPAAEPLRKKLADASPYVRVAAAEALGRYGAAADLQNALNVLIELAPAGKNGAYVSMMAMNAIDVLDQKARPWKDKIAALPKTDPSAPDRANGYVARLIEKTLADLH